MERSQRYRGILLALFFVSGACGLIYEVLWLRYFSSAFGITIYATSIVLAAFMGGLALGSYLFGRWAEQSSSPLRIYAYLEIGIGLYALLVPFIIESLPVLYRIVYLRLTDNLTLSLIIRFAASFLVLLVPTTMMGATLPVLSKFFAAVKERVGKEGGRLYAFNTFGAVAGTIGTGFILIPILGVSRTNTLAALLNLFIGMMAFFFTKRFGSLTPSASNLPGKRDRSRHDRGKKEPGKVIGFQPGRPGWILTVICLSGFAALSYEIIWTRVISIITFNTVFAFTAMLATFLTGIALGSYLFAKAIDGRKNLWSWFAVLQFSIATYALLSPFLFGGIAEHFYRYQIAAAVSGTSWGSLVLKQFSLAGLIMLLPTMLMGASFPLACKIYAMGTGKIASGVGTVYASNTFGAIAGSAITGLLLVPWLGLKGSLIIAASLNMLAGAVSLSRNISEKGSGLYRAAVIAPLIGGVFLLFVNVDVVFKDRITSGGKEIIFHQQDATGVVEVWEKDGHRFLVTNRLHTEGSNIPNEIYKMRKQGYLPLLLHSSPESFIEIGLGNSVGFAPVIYDRVKSAEVVEISSGIVNAAAYFAEESQNVLDHPKVMLRVDDGRNYLLLTPRKYDLVVLGLFTPYRSGVGYLYTREFYQLCKEKLKEGGMVFQWLALGQLSLDNLKTVVNTFRSVFPNVYLWEKGYYLGLLGMEKELKVDFDKFQTALKSPSIRKDLEKWGLNDPYNFLASYFMGPGDVERFVEGSPLNTEDNLWIEFSNLKVSKAVYSLAYAAENLAALLKYRRPAFGYLANMEGPERLELERYLEARRYSLEGLTHEARQMYRTAYEDFLRAESTNYKDDLARTALKKYRQAMN